MDKNNQKSEFLNYDDSAPFVISIEQFGIKTSVSIPHSDIGISQVAELMRMALMGAGYLPEQIAEMYKNL